MRRKSGTDDPIFSAPLLTPLLVEREELTATNQEESSHLDDVSPGEE
jgi:hypothetical protein